MSNYEFQMGDTICIEKLGMVCNIEKELGTGTQGKIYSLICPDNSTLALKWYYPSMATREQFNILKSLVEKHSPNNKFLWPLALVEVPSKIGFGYVMPLKTNEFVSFNMWLSRKIDLSFRSLLNACIELTQSFHVLHSYGFCYRDLSMNNIYFNPSNGEIQIGDTDNIVVNGDDRGNILGTPKFMAPEIVTGKSFPNTQSDLFSLAVILFYLLFLNHPLEGKRESSIKSLDLPAMNKLYGSDPLFIFDPYDVSNYPDPLYHKNAIIFWNIYPDYFKNLFTRSFTKGLRDPLYGRVRETEWLVSLISLRDSIFYCHECGSENFFIPNNRFNESLGVYEMAEIHDNRLNRIYHEGYRCWNENCNTSNQKILYIQINNQCCVVLNYDTKIYEYHVDANRNRDFTVPIAEVTHHPNNPKLWGLKNLSRNCWTVNIADGQIINLNSQKSILLSDKLSIDFGTSKGIVYYQ